MQAKKEMCCGVGNKEEEKESRAKPAAGPNTIN